MLGTVSRPLYGLRARGAPDHGFSQSGGQHTSSLLRTVLDFIYCSFDVSCVLSG